MKSKTVYPRLKNIRYGCYLTFFLILFFNLSSCRSDESEGPDCSLTGANFSVSDISGNWTATRAVFSLTATGPVQEVDIVAEGGSATLSIQSNGRFTLSILEAGEPNDTSSGNLCIDIDILVVSFDGDAPEDYDFFGIDFIQGSNNMTIGGPAEFDFNDDGTLQPANIQLDLIRS
ncbi:hypothetical protein [Spongiimicrobium sp. 3-5]|uniref:hypothetical protein n=1 Tax=Spongiimicrobium sp. 3-5 TaxID=3332596 RepID=UPI00397FA1AD